MLAQTPVFWHTSHAVITSVDAEMAPAAGRSVGDRLYARAERCLFARAWGSVRCPELWGAVDSCRVAQTLAHAHPQAAGGGGRPPG